jgi:2-hydroxychromene-2-carboxylate isomerase
MAGARPSLKFYYDIVCPFAYMTSTLMEGVAEKFGVTVNWTPVLLGEWHIGVSACLVWLVKLTLQT